MEIRRGNGTSSLTVGLGRQDGTSGHMAGNLDKLLSFGVSSPVRPLQVLSSLLGVSSTAGHGRESSACQHPTWVLAHLLLREISGAGLPGSKQLFLKSFLRGEARLSQGPPRPLEL